MKIQADDETEQEVKWNENEIKWNENQGASDREPRTHDKPNEAEGWKEREKAEKGKKWNEGIYEMKIMYDASVLSFGKYLFSMSKYRI